MTMQKPKVNFVDTPWMECECGGKLFDRSLMFKRVSKLLTGASNDEEIPIEVLICKGCGKVPEYT
jgi:hypothetical protein